MTEFMCQPSIPLIFLWIYLAKRTSPTSPFIIIRMTAPSDLSGTVLASSAPSVAIHSTPSHLKTMSRIGQSSKSPPLTVEFRAFYWILSVCVWVCEKSKLFIKQSSNVTCLWEFFRILSELCFFLLGRIFLAP